MRGGPGRGVRDVRRGPVRRCAVAVSGRVHARGVRPVRGGRSLGELDGPPGEDQVRVLDLRVRGLDGGELDAMAGGDSREGIARLNEVSDERGCCEQSFLWPFGLRRVRMTNRLGLLAGSSGTIPFALGQQKCLAQGSVLGRHGGYPRNGKAAIPAEP